MKLPNTAHTDRPWRIHEIRPDLRLYDVWALPTPGGPHDFPRLVQQLAKGDQLSSWAADQLVCWSDSSRPPAPRDEKAHRQQHHVAGRRGRLAQT